MNQVDLKKFNLVYEQYNKDTAGAAAAGAASFFSAFFAENALPMRIRTIISAIRPTKTTP